MRGITKDCLRAFGPARSAGASDAEGESEAASLGDMAFLPVSSTSMGKLGGRRAGCRAVEHPLLASRHHTLTRSEGAQLALLDGFPQVSNFSWPQAASLREFACAA
eukprot:CAMPEP_0181475878 /NCGR_PEP_ID=MMETSP1110-20121109/41417_1 /TAXON_ID=174948 /ORGANISM="Symbiodinium sp., Strain CCMP421" /LENGTH=105 /DNA_ID=CAMNT_0023601141 /DNA_START=349 /DNA_END=667 /DNA_ORIENTATION=+